MKTVLIVLVGSTLMGLLWGQPDFTISPTDLAVGRGREVWAATYRGLFRSSDAGATFVPVYINGAGLPQSRITSLLVDFSNPLVVYAAANFYRGGVWKSLNGGATWTKANTGLPVVGTADLALFQAPGNSSSLYAFAGRVVYKTTDGAASWRQLGSLPSASNQNALASFHVAGPLLLLFASGTTIFRSDDDGTTWRALSGSPLDGVTGAQILTVKTDPANPSVIYAATAPTISIGSNPATGFYRSSDGGTTWTKSLAAAVTGISADTSIPGRVFATSRRAGMQPANFYRSDDGGVTWRPPLALESPDNSIIRVDPSNPEFLYAPAAFGVARSLNGGESWQRIGVLRLTIVAQPSPVELYLSVGQGGSKWIELQPLELDPATLRCVTSVEGTGVRTEAPIGTSRTLTVMVDPMPVGVSLRTIVVSCDEAVETLRIPMRIETIDPLRLTESDAPLLGVLPQSGTDFTRPPRGRAMAADQEGNLYLNNRDGLVVKIASSGETLVIAGTQDNVALGSDGDSATSVRVDATALAVDRQGVVYLVDFQSIKKVTAEGIIRTVSATESIPFTGDHGTIASTLLNPVGLATDNRGNLYAVAGNRVVMITPDGDKTTIAGSIMGGFSGDGGPATAAELNNARSIVVDKDGSFFIADTGNHRIRKVTPNGVITTIAGNGRPGFGGDGGSAASATLFAPVSLAIDSTGTLYIVDSGNGRVRAIRPDGTIRTVAGDGADVTPFLPEGRSCGVANLLSMSIFTLGGLTSAAVAVDGSDNLYIADYQGRIFKVPASGPSGESRSARVSAILNAASYRPSELSSGGLVSLVGTNLAPFTARAQGGTLPRILANSFLCVNGVMSPLLYVSPTQLNAQVSNSLDLSRPAILAISNGTGLGSPHLAVNVARADPGIFTSDGRAIAVNEDGMLNSSARPAVVGSVMRVYVTGIGIVQSSSLINDGEPAPEIPLPAVWRTTATIGGQAAELRFIGTVPGTVGIGGVDLRVPMVGTGDQPVVITIDGKPSNPAMISVRQ